MFSPSAAAAKSLQSCQTLCDPIDGSPTRLPRPWDSQGKNTGLGCHFLLQCMKVKSESEVAQSCPTLSDPMDCSPPGSSIHGIFQARVLEWGAIAFSGSIWLGLLKWAQTLKVFVPLYLLIKLGMSTQDGWASWTRQLILWMSASFLTHPYPCTMSLWKKVTKKEGMETV